jgi:hypothetical protein
MSASESEPLGSLSGSEQQGDTSRSFRRQPGQSSINGHAVENAAVSPSVYVRSSPSNCLRSFSNNYRLPFMFVTGTVSFVDPPRCRTMGPVA